MTSSSKNLQPLLNLFALPILDQLYHTISAIIHFFRLALNKFSFLFKTSRLKKVLPKVSVSWSVLQLHTRGGGQQLYMLLEEDSGSYIFFATVYHHHHIVNSLLLGSHATRLDSPVSLPVNSQLVSHIRSFARHPCPFQKKRSSVYSRVTNKTIEKRGVVVKHMQHHLVSHQQ